MNEPRKENPKSVADFFTKFSIDQALAGQDIEELGPDAVDTLMAIVKKEAATYRRSRRNNIAIALFICVGMPVMMLIGTGLKTGNWHDFSNWGTFAAFAGVAGSVAATTVHKKALAKLAEFKDLRAVGPLTSSLGMGDKVTKVIVEAALVELLPQLKATDSDLLNAEQRTILNSRLKSGSVEFVVAILKAYQQIGDPRAIPFVERLATGEGKAAKDARVQAEIPITLEYLRQAKAREEASHTLLRASSGFEIPSDLLLRPATGVGTPTDSLELLRASIDDAGMQSDAESSLILEILNDVKLSGDPRALPYVRQLAEAPTAFPVVRDAARDCLQTLSAGNS